MLKNNKILVLLLFLFSLSMIVGSVNGADISLNSTDNFKSTIEDVANSGDTITLVSGREYSLDHSNVNIVIDNKNLTIMGSDSSNNAVINLNGYGRAFNITGRGNLTLINITIMNGYMTYGGAIYNEGSVNLISCSFINNSVYYYYEVFDEYNNSHRIGSHGGAIYNGGNVNLINCSFINNSAENTFLSGTAIYNGGSINLISCSFINNTLIDHTGSISVVGCNFINSGLRIGGNITSCNFINSGGVFSGNITSCNFINSGGVFSGNITSCNFINSGFRNEGISNISNCNFTGNSGIYNDQYGNITTNYCVFKDNPGIPIFNGGVYTDYFSVFMNSGFGITYTYTPTGIISSPSRAGAILSGGKVNLFGSSFINNTGGNGAISIAEKGSVNGINCSFINNTGLVGGAIHNFKGFVNFTSSIFENNVATFGGAIYTYKGDVILTNSILRNNTSNYNDHSASILNEEGGVSLINCLNYDVFIPLIKTVMGLNGSSYTNNSWNDLLNALQNVVNMNSVYNASFQSEIDALALGLSNAIKSLVTSDVILDPPDSELPDVEMPNSNESTTTTNESTTTKSILDDLLSALNRVLSHNDDGGTTSSDGNKLPNDVGSRSKDSSSSDSNVGDSSSNDDVGDSSAGVGYSDMSKSFVGDSSVSSQNSVDFSPASGPGENSPFTSSGGSSKSSNAYEIIENIKDLNDKNYLFGLIIGIIFAILFIFGFYKMGKNKGGI